MKEEVHIALYRKYRPAGFDEVRGQDHVTDALAAQAHSGSYSHAYLFAGPRGTGKTSVARIFAREIGCGNADLSEIDGASNRGIDEARRLREAAAVLPFSSPVKVYVIDEVHMLTREAANALLKIMEEPPAHVVFILATTEPHKVPDTIVSRCQVFRFKKPREADLAGTIKDIAEKEGVSIDPDAAAVIALVAEGSFRDAIGALERAMSGRAKRVTRADVEAATGAPRHEIVSDLVRALLESDAAAGLSAVAAARDAGVDMKLFARLLAEYLRLSMLIAFAPELADRIKEETGEREYEFLSSMARGDGARALPALLRRVIEAIAEIRFAEIPELPLEILAAERGLRVRKEE